MNECHNCRWNYKDYDSFRCRGCMEDAFINGIGFTNWTPEKEEKENDKFVQWDSKEWKKFALRIPSVLVGACRKALHL